ncbi:MAG: hypothetical protein WAT22_08880, partial [Saprospiraceae bacterium]
KIPYIDGHDGKSKFSTVEYSLWLEKPTAPPFEPRMVIETIRFPISVGIPVKNQTFYSKGYR